MNIYVVARWECSCSAKLSTKRSAELQAIATSFTVAARGMEEKEPHPRITKFPSF